MVPTDDPLAGLPPELVARIARQAGADADLTCHALDFVGLTPPPGGTRILPRVFLLELGAAMRLVIWEVDGLDLRAFSLPAPREAIDRVFDDAVRRHRDPSCPSSPSLSRAVLRVSIEQLAWMGPADLRAEIQLEEPDEDTLVEAMAQFLWDNRASFSAIDAGMAS